MPKSLKIVLGVLLGFVVWFAVATVGNLLIQLAGQLEKLKGQTTQRAFI